VSHVHECIYVWRTSCKVEISWHTLAIIRPRQRTRSLSLFLSLFVSLFFSCWAGYLGSVCVECVWRVCVSSVCVECVCLVCGMKDLKTWDLVVIVQGGDKLYDIFWASSALYLWSLALLRKRFKLIHMCKWLRQIWYELVTYEWVAMNESIDCTTLSLESRAITEIPISCCRLEVFNDVLLRYINDGPTDTSFAQATSPKIRNDQGSLKLLSPWEDIHDSDYYCSVKKC